MNIWELIKSKVALHLSTDAFRNWLGRTALREVGSLTIWVSVPSEPARRYIEQEYGG